MRVITHPGPVVAQRVDLQPCEAVALRLTLRAGLSLSTAIAGALRDAGFDYGYLRLDGLALAPLVYVTPAPAPGDGHAAWYSARHSLSEALLSHAGAHLGLREGKAFVHCHGLWQQGGMGHLLCDDCIVASDTQVRGWGIAGAGLVADADPETQFTLFRPKAMGTGKPNAALLTLRPNQDISMALDAVGSDFGAARVEGIGSLVGSRFSDATDLASYATEILLLDATTGAAGTMLSAASVGFDGQPQRGTLIAGQNAICVTAELLLLSEV